MQDPNVLEFLFVRQHFLRFCKALFVKLSVAFLQCGFFLLSHIRPLSLISISCFLNVLLGWYSARFLHSKLFFYCLF